MYKNTACLISFCVSLPWKGFLVKLCQNIHKDLHEYSTDGMMNGNYNNCVSETINICHNNNISFKLSIFYFTHILI